MSTPQGTAPKQELGFPFGKSFLVNISGGNYPDDATLVLSDEQGTPVARYRVGSKEKPILEQIVAIGPTPDGAVRFRFSLDFPTPAQIAQGYITGTYTFSFLPPGNVATTFFGRLKDPHKPGITEADDEWTAKAGGADDDETSEY